MKYHISKNKRISSENSIFLFIKIFHARFPYKNLIEKNLYCLVKSRIKAIKCHFMHIHIFKKKEGNKKWACEAY